MENQNLSKVKIPDPRTSLFTPIINSLNLDSATSIMNYLLLLEILYFLLVGFVCIRIVIDTTQSGKTLAYLLSTIFIPVLGILFYFTFGINYRKRKIYSKKLQMDHEMGNKVLEELKLFNQKNIDENKDNLGNAVSLVNLLMNDNNFPLTDENDVRVFVNGEEKFPAVLQAIRNAKHHIHIEYYIYENDEIGNTIKELLIAKVKEGVVVRFIYDDLGSRSIRRKFIRELKDSGVEAYPFNRIRLLFLANRINYRNHRKIIIIDGQTAFTGGINISDRYINSGKSKTFWRDTHFRIDGDAVIFLQYIFLCDWNFCANENIGVSRVYFRHFPKSLGNKAVQIAASGPDSVNSAIMLSYLKAINIAQREILITTPYFIPGESIIDALRVAALGGVSVKLLVPGKSDSRLVNAAAWSNYDDLLHAGVEIYLYQKGFVHAKTMVVDQKFSIIGTANFDYRSFDMNFEINAVIYDHETARILSQSFYTDLENADKIDPEQFHARPLFKQIPERIARLLSPIL